MTLESVSSIEEIELTEGRVSAFDQSSVRTLDIRELPIQTYRLPVRSSSRESNTFTKTLSVIMKNIFTCQYCCVEPHVTRERIFSSTSSAEILTLSATKRIIEITPVHKSTNRIIGKS